ncbi:hypothetical protein [Streptomyces mutabilis]|uniref:hypothetical protein n=1 Tax=Streptomyces mutabilis TaxID=67332 RepID=UPI0036AE2D7F
MNPADELRTAANNLRHEPQWIRLGHDALFGALADWLNQAARYYDAGVQAADDVFRDDPAGRDAFLTTGPGAPSEHALAVARQINGTAP